VTRLATSAQEIVPPYMSRLGFGCGGLFGGSDKRASLRLIQVAMDCGISYFDTARMYGYGEAEHILGGLTRSHRDRMILASKIGILPPNRSLFRRLVSRGVRLFHDTSPFTRHWLKAPDVWQPRFGKFELPDVRRSIETSLRALRTDYLDILLLHECTIGDVRNPQLSEFLQDIKTRGLVREYGIATKLDQTLELSAARPDLTAIVQIANSVWDMNIGRLAPRTGQLTITHSIFTSHFPTLLRRLASEPQLAEKWEAKTGLDPRDKLAAAQLFLAHAFWSNPGGIVLFSSSRPENIIGNSKYASMTPAQVDGLLSFFSAN
jgi:D-threo-aldose 1-dehydrogenase